MSAGCAAGGSASSGAGGVSTAANSAGSARPSTAKYAHALVTWALTSAYGYQRHSPGRAPPGRATPLPCAPPMLFGFRLRVWMPSFFMLSGRFTCNRGRVIPPSGLGDDDDVAAVPCGGKLLVIGGVRSYHPINKRIYSWGDN